MERREIHFAGRVQGVGFRYTTRQIAARFAVAGFVRNLPDGRVELVVEGEAPALDAFTAALADEMARYVQGQQVARLPASGEFIGFEIRH